MKPMDDRIDQFIGEISDVWVINELWTSAALTDTQKADAFDRLHRDLCILLGIAKMCHFVMTQEENALQEKLAKTVDK